MKYVIQHLGLLWTAMAIIATGAATAQNVNFEWVKGWGGKMGISVRALELDAKGNMYTVGAYQDSIYFNGDGAAVTLYAAANSSYLAKFDAKGKCLWAKSLKSSFQADITDLALDAADNIYVTGSFSDTVDLNPGAGTALFYDSTGGDIFFAKYDADGNYLWGKTLGGELNDVSNGITVDATGNLYITGQCRGTVDFNPGGTGGSLITEGTDAFLAKYDGNGNYMWSKAMGGSSTDLAYAVASDGTNGIYITGYFSSVTAAFNRGGSGGDLSRIGSQDVFLAKYDLNGNYIWAKGMGGSGLDRGIALAVDSKKNVFVTGYTGSATAEFNPGGTGGSLMIFGGIDVFVGKYAADGTYQWAKNMGSVNSEYGYGIAVDGSGNVYVTGEFGDNINFNPGGVADTLKPVGGVDMFVTKYDSDGAYIWARSAGGTDSDMGRTVVVDAEDNVFVTGTFSTTADFNLGTGKDTLQSKGYANGYLLKLSQGCEVFHSLIRKECDSFTFNGVVYTQSGIYTDTFVTAGSCDSIVTLDLSIGHTSAHTAVEGHYCDSVTFNGVTYNTTGTYTQSYKNSTDCDSSITYELTIGKSNGSILNQTACDSYTFNDTLTYTAGGTYNIVLRNTTGCDSIVSLQLTLHSNPKASITTTNGTLVAGGAEAYQWLDCDNQYAEIAEATAQTFKPQVSGNYAVVVTVNNCIDTSQCVELKVETRVNDFGKDNVVQIYPNPVRDMLTIETDRTLQRASIRLYNMVGQLLEESKERQGSFFVMDMSAFVPGIYYVDISEGEKGTRIKIVKE